MEYEIDVQMRTMGLGLGTSYDDGSFLCRQILAGEPFPGFLGVGGVYFDRIWCFKTERLFQILEYAGNCSTY